MKPALLPVPEAALAYFGAGKAKRKAEPIPERLPAGQRYPALRSLAGTTRRRGMGADAIAAALLVENKRLARHRPSLRTGAAGPGAGAARRAGAPPARG